MSRTALWIGSLLGAAALGWAAAMYVQAGAPLEGDGDAYVRFGNALRTPDALERTETLVKLTKTFVRLSFYLLELVKTSK